jgi:TPR repeat protein
MAAALASASYGQVYSARRLTQRIQPRQAPQAANRPQAAPQPQAPAPAPQQPVAAAPVYQPQYRVAAPAPAPAPVDPAKAAATKAKNDAKQFEFFKSRAEDGWDHAQYELGMRYLAGRGVAADEKLGREWLEKAAKNGNSQAVKKLAEMGEPKAEAPPAASDNKSSEPKTAEQK